MSQYGLCTRFILDVHEMFALISSKEDEMAGRLDDKSDAEYRFQVWVLYLEFYEELKRMLVNFPEDGRHLLVSMLVEELAMGSNQNEWESLLLGMAILKVGEVDVAVYKWVAHHFRNFLVTFHNERAPPRTYPLHQPYPGQVKMAKKIFKYGEKREGMQRDASSMRCTWEELQDALN